MTSIVASLDHCIWSLIDASADCVARLFQVQGEVGLNRKHSGTGLGLSICSQLATLMKGTISVQSTLGRGSIFTVKLPLRQVVTTPTATTLTNASIESTRPVIMPSTVEDVSSRHGLTDSPGNILPLSQISLPAQSVGDDITSAKPVAVPISGPSLETKSVRKDRKATKPDKSAPQHDFSKLRVLVAEDNKVNRECLRNINFYSGHFY
jgi:osomolarity two-component system, sensor histidine kinase SLN1